MLHVTVSGSTRQQAKQRKELTTSAPCLPNNVSLLPHSLLRDLWLPVGNRMLFSTLPQLSHTASMLCCRKTRNSICTTRDCQCFQHLVKILEPILVTACSPVLGFLGSTVTPGHGSLPPHWPELLSFPTPIHQDTAGTNYLETLQLANPCM